MKYLFKYLTSDEVFIAVFTLFFFIILIEPRGLFSPEKMFSQQVNDAVGGSKNEPKVVFLQQNAGIKISLCK